ncbi:apoptosis-resistant E3 ubiquitin protein ligase 1-like isoform X2 [Anneissia japonica]|uniref:apoptosis-resistant E3 ubiquitin protein ligase 1-like isoform X2 n=1 Tax=Anneissia japonica TaxID=1529436 RepID=UPI0014258E80|nr:apoptosis-resistant E3 ubiquitin protein ligase 1-like isoform X2 [Anneissia japonica]
MPQTSRYNYVAISALLLFAYCVLPAVGLEGSTLSSSMKAEGEDQGGRSFSSWLTGQGLEAYENVFYAVDCTLENCRHDIDMTHNAFRVLAPTAMAKVKQGILQLQNRTILLKWLQRIGLSHCFESFVAGGYVNLSKLHNLGLGPQPEDLKISAEDYAKIEAEAKRIHALRRKEEQVEDKRSCFAYWNIILILLFIIPFLYLRKGIYKFWDKRNFVDPLKSKITWGWEDGQVVGRMENFKVEFFYGWGSNYTVRSADDVSAEISVGSQAVPFQIERCENQQNAVKVSFTTRQSGMYYFNIRIGNKLISVKPYKKEFLPGSIAPAKSSFVNHSSTIVVCMDEMHALHLEVCDEYGNVCKERISPRSIKEYSMNVTSLDSSPIEIETPLWDVVVQDDNLLSLFIKIQEPGCFKAVVTYRGQPFSNGEFNIIVLSSDAIERVNKTVSKKNMDSYYEAKLLESNGEKLRKPKKVFCYISPKQLTIKEFYLKIIPKRLHTFRVCPSTKFNFQGNGEWPEFTIDDGGQDPVTLASESRDILAATYAKFLLKNIGGSETFKTKQEYFYQEVADKHKKSHRTIINLKIDRYSLLESSMKATKSFTTSDWCKKFEIKFLGEEGLDWGGLSREWFGIVCDSLFQSENQLFKSFKNDTQGLVHPNADRPQYMSKLKYFEFAGKIVGKCLYESSLGPSYTQLVRARFSRSFLAQLIGLRVTYKYFETDDPEFFMTKVRYLLDNNIDDLDLGLTFTEEIYNDHGQIDKVVNLKADGESIPVTDSNKIQYLNSLAQYKLSKCVEDEIEAFVKGLNDLIPDTLLSMFDENELELLMCGTSSFDIKDLREHHVAEGWKGAEGHKTLDWFWTVIAGFTQEEMSRLLQFTTGCGQLSSGGFSQLRPNFKIVSIGSHNTLPTAHTCFNQLCLPSYDSIEKLQKSLVIAINEGSTGFGLV